MFFELFILLIVVNGAPVITARLAKGRYCWPLDSGYRLNDKRPVFGKSKTWLGFFSAIILTSSLGLLLGFQLTFLLIFALIAMMGDLLTSFIKRRLDYPESSQFLLLDQLPESVLPLLWAAFSLGLNYWFALGIVSVFCLLHIFVSPILFKLGIRQKPY